MLYIHKSVRGCLPLFEWNQTERSAPGRRGYELVAEIEAGLKKEKKVCQYVRKVFGLWSNIYFGFLMTQVWIGQKLWSRTLLRLELMKPNYWEKCWPFMFLKTVNISKICWLLTFLNKCCISVLQKSSVTLEYRCEATLRFRQQNYLVRVWKKNIVLKY